MQHIETVTVASNAASITISNISQDYDDLLIYLSARSNQSGGNWTDTSLRPNGSTSNLTYRQLLGTGSSVVSTTETKWNVRISTGVNTANTFGNTQIYLPNYTSNVTKSVSIDVVTETNATAALQGIHAGLWNDTAAITSLVFIPDSGYNFVTGTTVTVYGILAGNDGSVSVS